jgi:hypothetical protein
VLYVTQSSLASKVSAAIADAGDFTNRGGKYRSDLFFLNQTQAKSLLLEVWFCDNTDDCNKSREHWDTICEAIAESISGYEMPDSGPPPEEIVPEPPTEQNRVDIVGHSQGDVAVVINGTLISGHARCRNIVRMRVNMTGDVVVSLNGEEFHNKPNEPDEPEMEVPPELEPIPENQKDITATVFGGEADNEYSAYGPYDSSGRGPYLNDTDLYVALPFRFEGERPLVRVFNANSEMSAIGEIMDIGPWCTTDDYWATGERPLAETCNHDGIPLPPDSGTNAGKIPSNDAGIDLSPGLADMIGIEGKGKVHWQFVTDEEVA